MKILIADDDVMTRPLLGSALKKLGPSVQAAKNGNEAWQAWLTGEFPLIISDWMMPGVDGLEFCRRVRAESGADYTYLVLLTSPPSPCIRPSLFCCSLGIVGAVAARQLTSEITARVEEGDDERAAKAFAALTNEVSKVDGALTAFREALA